MGQMASMFFNKGNSHSGVVRGTLLKSWPLEWGFHVGGQGRWVGAEHQRSRLAARPDLIPIVFLGFLAVHWPEE
ncbi:hypothetical protein ACQP3L_39370, partial [Escherichia coli]